jgi:hypothetical protein
MPSQLVGLRRKLQWVEFNGVPTAQESQEIQAVIAAAGGKTVGNAMIRSSFSVNYGGNPTTQPVLIPVPSAPGTFTLQDSITVTVSFDGGFKNIDPLSAKGKEILLDHEQGHYDLTALMARDCFIDLMQLKGRTFSSQAEGRKAAKDIEDAYTRKLKAIQKLYDKDTIHGAWVVPSGMHPERKESPQNKWEGFIFKALSHERTPSMTAPDGASYKKRLLDVLDDDGNFIFTP